MEIAVCNRFFEIKPENAEKARGKIFQFVKTSQAVEAISNVLVAVNTADDTSDALVILQGLSGCRAIGVNPWGKFVPPLNALISEAAKMGHTHVLFLSTEVVLTSGIVTAFQRHMDADTLVVGARMEGHDFQPGPGPIECNGVTSPWNTCAFYDLTKLVRLGVPMTGDALFDASGQNAGVEEVATIALYQRLYADCKAKLIQVPGLTWETEKLEGDRLVAHQRKMASKVKRPETQLDYARLQPGKVYHIA